MVTRRRSRILLETPVLFAPTWSSKPVISSLAKEDVEATFVSGVYSGTPTPSVSYRWKVDGVAVGSVDTPYTPVTADVGKTLTVTQTATNSEGTVSSTSDGLVISAVDVGGDLVAVLTATALTGTAPLAVMFDATGTTSGLVDDTFRQITYTFNYGDPYATGNWPHSGRTRATDIGGPLATHVFEQPGLYVVNVTAARGGITSTASVTITVADPDVTYSGTKTVCISTDGSTGWGPAGATYQTTLPTGSGWTGKRWLFKRGQNFAAVFGNRVTVNAANENYMIAAAGTGAKPILPGLISQSSRPSTQRADGTAICNDYVTVTDVQMADEFGVANSTDVLLHKVDFIETITGASPGVDMSSDYWALLDPRKPYATTAYRLPARRTVSECTFDGGYLSTSTNVLCYAEGRYMSFIGNKFIGGAVEHNLRTPYMWKGFIAHNRMHGGYKVPGKHCITARSAGLLSGDYEVYQEFMVPLGKTAIAQRYSVISWNDLGGTNDYPRDGGLPAVTLEVSSQNHTNAEGSEDVLLEGNVLRPRPSGFDGSGAEEMWICGRRVTYLNNTRTADGLAVDVVTNWKSGGIPADWKGPYYTSRT